MSNPVANVTPSSFFGPGAFVDRAAAASANLPESSPTGFLLDSGIGFAFGSVLFPPGVNVLDRPVFNLFPVFPINIFLSPVGVIVCPSGFLDAVPGIFSPGSPLDVGFVFSTSLANVTPSSFGFFAVKISSPD